MLSRVMGLELFLAKFVSPAWNAKWHHMVSILQTRCPKRDALQACVQEFVNVKSLALSAILVDFCYSKHLFAMAGAENLIPVEGWVGIQ